jgi:signal transduction histidine kinase
LILALVASCCLIQEKTSYAMKPVPRVLVFYALGVWEAGYPQSSAMEGKIVSRIAVRVPDGERPQDVPVVLGTNDYIVDWHAPMRWGFKESGPRPGSAVMFLISPLWERTKWMWVAALLIFLCVSVVALYVRLKLAKNRELGLSGMLIKAQEKERSRLASEIHDDFSQRLALLALGLQNAEEAIATSPDEAVRQVHNLVNSASEIGADLHTLSHRLHSATLERLGLVPGVTALCKEFTTQQGIEVDFLSDNVPRAVHPDVALCIFRIVQEGLRNLRKHSSAAKAQVRLRRAGDRLVVFVRDEGVGFDMRQLGHKEGLGIRSMEERTYLLRGRFEIHSEPGKGTRIEAWVPLQTKSELVTG